MKDTLVDYTLLSTSTTLSRVRGFTIELIFHLRDGSLRTYGLCELTQRTNQYVSAYLKNMRKYGLAEKKGPFWNLTDLGRDFSSYLEREGKYNNVIQKKQERSKKERRKKEETSHIKTLKQVSISLWLQSSDRQDLEKEVVEVLLKHYNETGSKFILIKDQFELSEKLKANPGDIQVALKNLRQDNIIYLYRSEVEGYWKIGLKKAFLETLSKA